MNLLLTFLLLILSTHAEIKVFSDFEGGSAKEVQVKGNHVTFKPGGNFNRGFTSWWYARLEGVDTSQPLTLTINADKLRQSGGRGIGSYWAMPNKMTWSTDQKKWQHSAQGTKTTKTMTWEVDKPKSTVWVAWGAPFVPADSKVLAEKLKSKICQPFILCKTREGRDVQAFKITSKDDGAKKVVWVHARQHAWECGSSWVAKGLVTFLTGNSKEASDIRNKAIVYLVPIMDVDNAATGNGGKEQDPHDHNRDWSDKPHWHSVAAAQKILKGHVKGNGVCLFLDLHNPGPGDKDTFLFLSPKEIMSESSHKTQTEFVENLKKAVTGPLAFKGKTRISGKGYHPLWKQISKTWFNLNFRDSSCGLTIEVPWNNPSSLPAGYEETGKEIGKAIYNYLQDK